MTIIFTGLPADEMPAREQVITHKLGTDKTHLRGSVFVHVGYVVKDGRRKLTGIRLSEKGKDGSSLDLLLTAIDDALTDIIRKDINGDAQ